MYYNRRNAFPSREENLCIPCPHQDTIQYPPPRRPPSTKAVKIPAPALSAVDIVSYANGLLSPFPASGSPTDVPPVPFPTGPRTLSMRLDWKTSRAFICCPTPNPPSHSPAVQDVPQVTPLLPPVHYNRRVSTSTPSHSAHLFDLPTWLPLLPMI